MNRKKLGIATFVLLFVLGAFFTDLQNTADAKTNKIAKTLNMNQGVKYKIPLKKPKQYTFRSTNKKIATVNKKGVVNALKSGKCTIKALKKKKVYKYKIIVNNKENNMSNEVASDNVDKNEKAYTTNWSELLKISPEEEINSSSDQTEVITGGNYATFCGQILKIESCDVKDFKYLLIFENNSETQSIFNSEYKDKDYIIAGTRFLDSNIKEGTKVSVNLFKIKSTTVGENFVAMPAVSVSAIE